MLGRGLVRPVPPFCIFFVNNALMCSGCELPAHGSTRDCVLAGVASHGQASCGSRPAARTHFFSEHRQNKKRSTGRLGRGVEDPEFPRCSSGDSRPALAAATHGQAEWPLDLAGRQRRRIDQPKRGERQSRPAARPHFPSSSGGLQSVQSRGVFAGRFWGSATMAGATGTVANSKPWAVARCRT